MIGFQIDGSAAVGASRLGAQGKNQAVQMERYATILLQVAVLVVQVEEVEGSLAQVAAVHLEAEAAILRREAVSSLYRRRCSVLWWWRWESVWRGPLEWWKVTFRGGLKVVEGYSSYLIFSVDRKRINFA